MTRSLLAINLACVLVACSDPVLEGDTTLDGADPSVVTDDGSAPPSTDDAAVVDTVDSAVPPPPPVAGLEVKPGEYWGLPANYPAKSPHGGLYQIWGKAVHGS